MIDFGNMASPANDTHKTVNLDLKKDSAGITLDLKRQMEEVCVKSILGHHGTLL